MISIYDFRVSDKSLSEIGYWF